MLLDSNHSKHLTYCLNVHPGETWAQNFSAIKEKATKVKQLVAPEKSFGLGLRLGAAAAAELDKQKLAKFKSYLEDSGLYVFTINGFPYGDFHNTVVKEKVYQPDWRTAARRDYTIQLCDILAELLEDGVSGSISTVPLSYSDTSLSNADLDAMVCMLSDIAVYLDKIYRDHGKDICIGLEPEPDCLIENTDEAIDFFANRLMPAAKKYCLKKHNLKPVQTQEIIARHLGLCFDTAHAAVQFEDMANSLRKADEDGIRICKVQLSSALSLKPSKAAFDQLEAFSDAVYLHQVKALTKTGRIVSYPDLDAALEDCQAGLLAHEQWRVHFHVPLFFERNERLCSTSEFLDNEFFKYATTVADHFEIETYTFNVLPKKMQEIGVVNSIAKEYKWVLDKFV